MITISRIFLTIAL